MASFDAFAGKELDGEWLHFYTWNDMPFRKDKSPDLDYYIGVDPAISLSDKADHFALTVVGVTMNRGQVFIIEQIKRRISFPEQLELINEMNTCPRFIVTPTTVRAK